MLKPSPALVIRAPAPSDAPAWALFLAESQARTYSSMAPAEFAPQLFAEVEASAAELAAAFADTQDAVRLLAEQDGMIVGVASTRSAPAPWEVKYGHVDVPAERQLERLYLHPEWQGSGLADQLLTGVLDDRAVYLWLIAGNTRAHRFYRRRGFVDLPESVPAGMAWGHIRMYRMLRPARAGTELSAAGDPPQT